MCADSEYAGKFRRQLRNFYLTLKINELIPKKANAVESYVLLGVARETENLYIITSVVNRFTNQIDSIDVLYSTNIKKESAVSKTRASGITLQSLTDSKISISDLLNIVKDKTPEVLSKDVLNHYGLQRGDSEIERGLIYSAKQTDPIQAHYAEVMRENRNLKNIISALDDMQYSSARSNIHLDGRDIHNIAGRLLGNASSKYDKEQLTARLTALFDYMANSNEVVWEDVMMKSSEEIA